MLHTKLVVELKVCLCLNVVFNNQESLFSEQHHLRASSEILYVEVILMHYPEAQNTWP